MIYSIFILLAISFAVTIIVSNNSLVYKKNNSSTNVLTICFPILLFGLVIIGFRPLDSGGDTIAYLRAFERLESLKGSVQEAAYGSELLFWPLQRIIKYLFDERGWLITNFVIIYLLSLLAYKKATTGLQISSTIFSLVVLTYFGPYAGNTMRQAIAVPFLILAFYSFYNKKNIAGIFYSLLAIGFHWSSIIITACMFFLKIPNRTGLYIIIPLGFLCLSIAFFPIFDFAIQYIKIGWINEKAKLYLYGGRISHIEAIYKTLNFWFCILIYIMVILSKVHRMPGGDILTKFLMMILSIMLFFIGNPDISERNMVYFLFISPLAITLIIERYKMHPFIKNTVYLAIFFTLALLVYTNSSTQRTLGLI